MTLHGQVILIVDNRPGPFIEQLEEDLRTAGAETIVARDAAHAVQLLRRFDCTAVCLGPIQESMALLGEIGGVPLVTYGRSAKVQTVVASVVGLRQAGCQLDG
jgi:translation initiation factor 2B subunit (eIF-2B alpha/beta/delta family)